jgi:hypothetical protein
MLVNVLFVGHHIILGGTLGRSSSGSILMIGAVRSPIGL